MLVHWIWYSMLDGVSLRQKRMLLEHFSGPEEIFFEDDFSHVPDMKPELAECLKNKDLKPAQEVVRRCADKRIGIVCFQDAAYPSRLRQIADPPMVLYYKGMLPEMESRPVIGIVGTRKATGYGLGAARTLSGQITACGGLVVSGGAFGIDSLAMQGALEAGGQTLAVLGCGVDVVYPKSNRGLFENVEKSGCLLSEFLPGTQPKPWHFPQRNRIISGLSDGVLVVEAPERSGALITADMAADQGRDLFAVPGNIGVASCAGSNALLQEGAMAVMSGWDLIRTYEYRFPDIVHKQGVQLCADTQTPEPGVSEDKPVNRADTDKKDIDNPGNSPYSVLNNENCRLTEEEKTVAACLGPDTVPVDEVIARSGMPAGKVLGLLSRLAIKGMVEMHPGRRVSAKKQ